MAPCDIPVILEIFLWYKESTFFSNMSFFSCRYCTITTHYEGLTSTRQTVFISVFSTFSHKLSYPPCRQLFCNQSQRTEHHLHPKRLVGRNSSPGEHFQLCPPWRGIPYYADRPGHTGEHEPSPGEGRGQKHSPSACRVAGLAGVHLWMSNDENMIKMRLALTRSVV